MSKIFFIIAVLAILSLGLAARSQANSMAQNEFTTYDTTKLIGLTVKARDGVELGQILDLVVDSHGHVDFAIVNQPGFEEFSGGLVVVPFGTLTISKTKSGNIRVVFNENKEKFYEGPEWGYENLNDLKQAALVDRYYGIQPYWTEAVGKESKLEKYNAMFEKVDEAKRDAFAFASLLSVAYIGSESSATCSPGKRGFIAFDMYGVPVRNSDGEFLGSITDILMSKRDHDNAFVIINIGSSSEYGDSGGLTLVPMAALSFPETRSGKLGIVLNSTEANLEAAPPFDDTKIDNSQYEIQLDRYYGVQPYWTEECMAHGK